MGAFSEFPVRKFYRMDRGKTNAARPSKMSEMMIPKIPSDVLKLGKIRKLGFKVVSWGKC
jgi:hypothetical protein